MRSRRHPLVVSAVLGLALAGCGGSSGGDKQPAATHHPADTPATNPNPSTPKDCLASGERRGSRLWVGRWSGEVVRIQRFDSPAAARRAVGRAGSAAAPVAGFAVFAPRSAVVRQVAVCLAQVPYRAAPRRTATTPATPQPTGTQTTQSQSQQCPPGQTPNGVGGCASNGGAPSVDSPAGQRRLRTDPDCKGVPPPPPSYHGPVQC